MCEIYEDITPHVIQKILWQEMVENGEFVLLEKLNAVEKHNFETVVVPHGGFSRNDRIHNMTIDWLKMKGCFVLDVGREILELTNALHGEADE